jgi:hypothetical protein
VKIRKRAQYLFNFLFSKNFFIHWEIIFIFVAYFKKSPLVQAQTYIYNENYRVLPLLSGLSSIKEDNLNSGMRLKM